jgi:hypothetical protein
MSTTFFFFFLMFKAIMDSNIENDKTYITHDFKA